MHTHSPIVRHSIEVFVGAFRGVAFSRSLTECSQFVGRGLLFMFCSGAWYWYFLVSTNSCCLWVKQRGPCVSVCMGVRWGQVQFVHACCYLGILDVLVFCVSCVIIVVFMRLFSENIPLTWCVVWFMLCCQFQMFYCGLVVSCLFARSVFDE